MNAQSTTIRAGFARTWLGLVLALAGCAASAPALGAQNPANPSATPGRLAGAPPALRAGVVTYPDLPAVRTAPAEHHHHAE